MITLTIPQCQELSSWAIGVGFFVLAVLIIVLCWPVTK